MGGHPAGSPFHSCVSIPSKHSVPTSCVQSAESESTEKVFSGKDVIPDCMRQSSVIPGVPQQVVSKKSLDKTPPKILIYGTFGDP